MTEEHTYDVLLRKFRRNTFKVSIQSSRHSNNHHSNHHVIPTCCQQSVINMSTQSAKLVEAYRLYIRSRLTYLFLDSFQHPSTTLCPSPHTRLVTFLTRNTGGEGYSGFGPKSRALSTLPGLHTKYAYYFIWLCVSVNLWKTFSRGSFSCGGEMKPHESLKLFSQVVHKRVNFSRLHLLTIPPGGQRV